MHRFCKTSREYMSDVLDGEETPWWARVQVNFHLALCPYCKKVRRSLEGTVDALKQLKDAPTESKSK